MLVTTNTARLHREKPVPVTVSIDSDFLIQLIMNLLNKQAKIVEAQTPALDVLYVFIQLICAVSAASTGDHQPAVKFSPNLNQLRCLSTSPSHPLPRLTPGLLPCSLYGPY